MGYGLRWEYVAPIADRNDLLGKVRSPSAPPQGWCSKESNSTNCIANSKDDFAPRLGIAWDIRGKGTTVFARAGGTIVYNSDQSLKVFLNSANAARLRPHSVGAHQPNGAPNSGSSGYEPQHRHRYSQLE